MIDVTVRGGTFPPGTTCEFRNDQFHFDQDVAASGDAKLYIGDALEARVIEETRATTTSPDAGIIMGAAAIGALIVACWNGFHPSIGMLFGAIVCGWLASTTDVDIPSQTTFEMRFSNGRSLVGTVETTEWARIQNAWRVLSSATPSILRPATAQPA